MIFGPKKEAISDETASKEKIFRYPTLFRADCFNGTYIGAGATVCTQFRINHIYISLGDSFDRTLINTSTTCGTII